jgi:hypothetical protein
MSLTTSKTTSKTTSRYPFINDFVNSMCSINAHEYVSSNETDFKSILFFFKLYVISCRSLRSKEIELNPETISDLMQHEYDLWRIDNSRIKVAETDFSEDPSRTDKFIKFQL